MRPILRQLLLFGRGIGWPPWLYRFGVENVAWVEGTGYWNPRINIKESDHLYIRVQRNGTTIQGVYVTDIDVDLTNISTLCVDWENIGDASNNNQSYLVASTTKDGVHSTANAKRENINAFARKVDTLDVSSLTGSYYVRVHARADADGITSELKVYRVWGER